MYVDVKRSFFIGCVCFAIVSCGETGENSSSKLLPIGPEATPEPVVVEPRPVPTMVPPSPATPAPSPVTPSPVPPVVEPPEPMPAPVTPLPSPATPTPPTPAPAPTPVPGNSAPKGGNDIALANEDSPITINVLANDRDDDGDTLYVIAASSGEGNVTINADYSLSFSPKENFYGDAVLSYTLSDGLESVNVNVDVTVFPINDAPMAVDDDVSVDQYSNENVIDVLENDQDVDDVTLSIASAQASFGEVTIENNLLSYTPADDAVADMISYQVRDSKGETSEGVVAVGVLPVDGLPVEFSWTPPSSRENGEPVSQSELNGYEVVYRLAREDFSAPVTVSGGSVMDFTVLVPKPGEYEFWIATIDKDGRTSVYNGPLMTTVGN